MIVVIHHPEFGAVPAQYEGVYNDRAELLRAMRLTPRNLDLGPRHAGFKGVKFEAELGHLCFGVHWFTPDLGELFKQLWLAYLQQFSFEPKHPYAFVNLHGGAGVLGAPLTLDRFRQSHEAAVQRIGLTVRKEAGTTPHGHRHAYAFRLSEAGLSESIIQRCMHQPISSQRVYTEPTVNGIAEKLREANALRNGRQGGTDDDSTTR